MSSMTALHVAIFRVNVEAIRVLLANEADTELTMADPGTAKFTAKDIAMSLDETCVPEEVKN